MYSAESETCWLTLTRAVVEDPRRILHAAEMVARVGRHAHACAGAMIRHADNDASLIAALCAAAALTPRPMLHWTEWQIVCSRIVRKCPPPGPALLTAALNAIISGGTTAALQLACTPDMATALALIAECTEEDNLKILARGALAAMQLASSSSMESPPSLSKCVLAVLPAPFTPAPDHFPDAMRCIVCLCGGSEPWQALPCGCVLHAACFARWCREDNVSFWRLPQCLVCRADLLDLVRKTIS